MSDLTLREIPQEAGYFEFQEHEYRGVHFFTARYSNYIVAEPRHQEVLDVSNEIEGALNQIDAMMWWHSSHTWADGLTLQEQRERCIEYMQKDIDKILDCSLVNNMTDEFLQRKNRVILAICQLQRISGEEKIQPKEEPMTDDD